MADAGMISLEKREYLDGDLEGAFIAIAATDDSALNERISREATARNVPLNVVDVTHLCTFIAPSIVRKGEVTVAISTAGLSPALARKLRDGTAEQPGPRLRRPRAHAFRSETRASERGRRDRCGPLAEPVSTRSW